MSKSKWIQKAVKRKGRVHRYLKRLYGSKAFTRNGDIKISYIDKAIKHVKKAKMSKEKKRSLLAALYLAKRLKRMHK